jgi:hypothetical protein
LTNPAAIVLMAGRLVVVMKEAGSGKGNGPEADNKGADGEDPVADAAVAGGKGGGFAGAENLAADADGHEESAEDEGGPGHGLTFLPQSR